MGGGDGAHTGILMCYLCTMGFILVQGVIRERKYLDFVTNYGYKFIYVHMQPIPCDNLNVLRYVSPMIS